jgi:hypothetical protein
MKTLPDQKDFIEKCEQLRLRAVCLRIQLYASTGDAIAPPTLSNGIDIIGDVSALENHIKELEGRLGDVAQALNAPAAKPAAPVQNTAPVEQAQPANQPVKMTLTERILAARGVTKICDLPHRKSLD